MQEAAATRSKRAGIKWWQHLLRIRLRVLVGQRTRRRARCQSPIGCIVPEAGRQGVEYRRKHEREESDRQKSTFLARRKKLQSEALQSGQSRGLADFRPKCLQFHHMKENARLVA